MGQVVTVTQQQDSLRPVRNFVSLLAGATADQTYADYDLWAANVPGQFVAQNPWGGVSQEGQPVLIQATAGSQGAALSASSPLVLVGLAVVAYLLLK